MTPRVALVLLAAALSAQTVSAQVPLGSEFRVNTYTPGPQARSDVAADAAGNFVAVWHSGHDGSANGVFAQRFDAAGAPRGGEFRVNTHTTGSQSYPAVAGGASGNFVVVWAGEGPGDPAGIFGQRFDTQGGPLGPEFRVNLDPAFSQSAPDVAAAAGGSFVVTWTSAGQDGMGGGIFGQRFDAAGAALGAAFQVNTTTTRNQYDSSVAADSAGNFVVVWASDQGYPGLPDIFGQRFSAAGSPRGGEFLVNTTTDDWQYFPSVASNAAGDFVVAWGMRDYSVKFFFFSIRAQRFDAAGLRRGTEFQVDGQPASNFKGFPSAASDRTGNFTVAWMSAFPVQQTGIFARRYNAFGAPMASEFRVDSFANGLPSEPAAATDGGGRAVVTWTSQGQDGSSTGVFGLRYGRIAPAAMVLDTAPSGSTNGNGVLEPGESVDVGPFWRNLSGAARTFGGTAQFFTGPPAAGVSYMLQDFIGDYGTVADGATQVCINCYQVQVTHAGTRPATHWDATLTEAINHATLGEVMPWSLHVGRSFTDVPDTSVYYRDVETVLHRGITAGCGTSLYCPANVTTREQMAAFVLLAKESSAYTAAPCSPPNVFLDVPETSPFCDVIEELARRGVVSGCGGGNYCPTAAVSREQMAVFVLRTLDPALDPPACGTPVFNDVPADSPFCRWIEELARRGVVGGCGGGSYCPTAPVTREQMAVFLSGTFGLQLYGP